MGILYNNNWECEKVSYYDDGLLLLVNVGFGVLFIIIENKGICDC